jgi:hypothetical protein
MVNEPILDRAPDRSDEGRMNDLADLQSAAEGGDVRAQFDLARRLYDENRPGEALPWLERAAKGGDAQASLALGMRMLTGHGAPMNPHAAGQHIADAARRGDPEACRALAALAAEGCTMPQDWAVALDALQRGAELGDASCREQLALLTSDVGARAAIEAGDAGETIWAQARAAIDITAWLRTVPGKSLSQAPRIWTFDDFLEPEICAWMIRQADGKLTPAAIYDDTSGAPLKSERRSNTHCVFHPVRADVVQAIVRARIAKVAALPQDHLELLSVLHYDPGQEFRRHVDFLDANLPRLAEELARFGQRLATCLIYLNEDFDGAETEFPVLALRWKGKIGGAILFWNVEPSGALDRRTMHAGRPPTRGEKWLLSQFVREKPQPLPSP